MNIHKYTAGSIVKNQHCIAMVDSTAYRCAIGKHGVTKDKVEGDGKTPIGEFPLRQLYVRMDKIVKNKLKYVSLPVQAIKPEDGWCDDPKNKDYNKLVNLHNFDHSISHETMYRTDDKYNILLVVGYNDDPIVPGKGSAIFVHVATPEYSGTAGCVAFSEADLLRILAKLNDKSKLIVNN